MLARSCPGGVEGDGKEGGGGKRVDVGGESRLGYDFGDTRHCAVGDRNKIVEVLWGW